VPGYAVGEAFARSREAFAEAEAWLGGPQAGGLEHGELEEQMEDRGRELLRLMLQDHLDLRAAREPRAAGAAGAGAAGAGAAGAGVVLGADCDVADVVPGALDGACAGGRRLRWAWWWPRWRWRTTAAVVVGDGVATAGRMTRLWPGNAWAATSVSSPVTATVAPISTRLAVRSRRSAASRPAGVNDGVVRLIQRGWRRPLKQHLCVDENSPMAATDDFLAG